MRTHSRPQSPRSFWPVAGIESSGQKAGPDFLSMRRVSVSSYQPIRFARFDGKSVNCGLPVLDKAWAIPELSILATGQKDRGLWGREWHSCHRPEGSWALETRIETLSTTTGATTTAYRKQIFCSGHAQKLNRDFKQRERGRRRGRRNRWEDWGENAVVTEIHKHKQHRQKP